MFCGVLGVFFGLFFYNEDGETLEYLAQRGGRTFNHLCDPSLGSLQYLQLNLQFMSLVLRNLELDAGPICLRRAEQTGVTTSLHPVAILCLMQPWQTVATFGDSPST